MKVFLDDRKNGGRKLVDAELIEERATTVKVKLLQLDGAVITRKKNRDLPKGES